MQNLRMISDEPCFVKEYKDEEDVFNHDVIADTLLGIVKDNDPPMTIGLFGGWGIGKSSIINLFASKIRDKEYRNDYGYVYFNAWQYSGDSFRRQFLLEVAQSEDVGASEKEIERLRRLNHSSLIKERREELYVTRREKWIFSFFIILLLVALTIIPRVVDFNDKTWVGVSLIAAVIAVIGLFINQLRQLISVKIDNVIDPQLIFPEQFGDEFVKLIAEAKKGHSNKKYVIVIDDLDRCDLETIRSVLQHISKIVDS